MSGRTGSPGPTVEIIKPSTLQNPAIPKQGQTVVLHYRGTLQDGGQEFDNSHRRGRPFKFKLGRGEVIRAWDIGVAQLKVGDQARFTCPPDYAYGKAGHPGVIPENATLIFEVELLGIE